MIEAPNHVTRFLNAFERLYYFPLYLSFRNILCLIDSPDKSLKKIYMLYVQVTRKKKKKKKKTVEGKEIIQTNWLWSLG